jgi:hypothetical protein
VSSFNIFSGFFDVDGELMVSLGNVADMGLCCMFCPFYGEGTKTDDGMDLFFFVGLMALTLLKSVLSR